MYMSPLGMLPSMAVFASSNVGEQCYCVRHKAWKNSIMAERLRDISFNPLECLNQLKDHCLNPQRPGNVQPL